MKKEIGQTPFSPLKDRICKMTARKSRSSTDTPVIREVRKSAETEEEPVSTFASIREVVESLVFALFLAFTIKSFEVEAFVIPTGSMAPTLKGRHKDLACNQCGFPFQVNASDEVDSSTNRRNGMAVIGGTCTQCGYTQYFGPGSTSFTGDRILVSKSAFDLRPLHRWDVSVFRYPKEPRTNFIKRIVGLPNERIRVQYGDIFVQKKLADDQWSDFEIARKPLVYLKQMLQTVYDGNYVSDRLKEVHWYPRWSDELTEMRQGVSGWIPLDDGRRFRYTGKTVPSDTTASAPMSIPQDMIVKREIDESTAGFQWLRYRHLLPSTTDWFNFLSGRSSADVRNGSRTTTGPRLITDMTAYNTQISQGISSISEFRDPALIHLPPKPESLGLNWIGDLALSCELTFDDLSQYPKGIIIFELVKGSQTFRCRICPAVGQVTLEIPGIPSWPGENGICSFKKGKNTVIFMNIDEQLRLEVNGKEVVFANEGRYDDLCRPLPGGRPGVLPRDRDPGEKDLIPAAIGARDIPVEIGELKILRDLYYIAGGKHLLPVTGQEPGEYIDLNSNRCDRLPTVKVDFKHENDILSFFTHPVKWQGFGRTHCAEFELKEGQYLAFGDNSAVSHDSRFWDTESPAIPYYVDKKYLTGKAFYVYWPHGHLIPGTKLPFVPNVGKMRHID